MRRRSLWPREHGAYFQLAIPLVTACLVRAPTVPAILLAVGAALAFLAHEPLLVLLGYRGARQREAMRPRARNRLAMLLGGALLLGVIGLELSPPAVSAAVIVAVPALVLLAFAWRRAEHTIAGELVAAIALTGASLPVLVASGTPLERAVETWIGFALGFCASVLAVHLVMARNKRTPPKTDRVIAVGVIAALAAGLATGSLVFSVASPLVVFAAGLGMSPPSAAKLRVIGVAIVIAGVASSAIALLR